MFEMIFEFSKQFLFISGARIDQIPDHFGSVVASAAPDAADFKAQSVMSA